MWQGLKWVIRDLRLNTGQNFWKNHVTREDLQKVTSLHVLPSMLPCVMLRSVLLLSLRRKMWRIGSPMYLGGWQLNYNNSIVRKTSLTTKVFLSKAMFNTVRT